MLNSENPWLDILEVQRLLAPDGANIQAIHESISNGLLKYHRFGNRCYFRLEDVENYRLTHK